jgi:hypothetical protein
VDERTLSDHLKELNRIQCEFGVMLANHRPEEEERDLLAFSDLLDQGLAPWLRRLAEFFAQLHATTGTGK